MDVLGDNLTPLDIVKFVSAYATWLKTGAGKTRAKIVLGRDARISGEMYAKLVEATLSGLGHDVVNIGLGNDSNNGDRCYCRTGRWRNYSHGKSQSETMECFEIIK